MKQQIKRLNVSSQAQIKFRYQAKIFFVKNYTNGDIFVSFEEVTNDDYSEYRWDAGYVYIYKP